MKPILLSCLVAVVVLTSVKGSEFQVNTRTSLSQANADISALPDGGFAVVWSSYFGTAGRSNDIFCRIFEPNCSPAGIEFQVNKNSSGNQTEPAIALKPSGELLVVWQGPGVSEADGDDICAQKVDVNGLPIGEEFRVNNTKIQNDQSCPKIAINNTGACIIVWESETEPNSTIICCRRYDSTGNAAGDEFQVNLTTDGRYPDAAIDKNGNFTIVWVEGKRPNFSIMARLYDSSGTALAAPFKVNTIDITSFTQPDIAKDSITGCFLISWDGDKNLAGNDDVFTRIYEPNGAPRGEQFKVNTAADMAQQNPQAAINEKGQFIIVWDSDGDPNSNKKDVFASRFNINGQRIGDEYRLNSYTDSDQKSPSVAILNNGRFVSVWQSLNQDGSEYGVFGKSEQMISAADFNQDGLVNFQDFNLLATEWHTINPYISDIIDDNSVDVLDLFAFCQNWLKF